MVVVSNNDGCVISRSAEARALGIAMGEPFFKLNQRTFPAELYVFSSNYPLYADMSARVMQTLTDMAPAIEIYSIDEAFIDLSGIGRSISLDAFGHEMRNDVVRQRKLLALVPVSEVWGIGKRISKKLNAMGINSALELADSVPWVIKKHFNVVMERTLRKLRGGKG